MGQPNLPQDIGSLLADIDRRLRALEVAPRMPFSSVTGGAFVVRDDFGVIRARFGKLSDGTYGIEVDNAAGTPLSIGASLFGIAVAKRPNITTLTGSFQDLGLTLSATAGASGNVAVVYGAHGAVTADGSGNGWIQADLFVDGVDTNPPSFGLNMFPSSTASASIAAPVVTAEMLTGLSAGAHTITMQGIRNSGASGTWSNKWVLAFPV